MYDSQTRWKVQVFVIPTPNLQFPCLICPSSPQLQRKKKGRGLVGSSLWLQQIMGLRVKVGMGNGIYGLKKAETLLAGLGQESSELKS